jgi:SAM-dependent methyltransferase
MKPWDRIWSNTEGRKRWLEPDPVVVSHLPGLKSEGVDKVLDLGFGLGRHYILLAEEGLDVYGLESSPQGTEFAAGWAESENAPLKLTIGDMSALPFENSFFDLILAWYVIYHGAAENVRWTVDEIRRCLKLGGYLLCTLISTKNVHCGVGEEIEPCTFVSHDDPEKSHPHHYFDRQEIDDFLRGFDLLHCEDVERRPGSFHWHVLATLASKERPGSD